MSACKSLIPEELTAAKDEAAKVMEELEGDLLDQVDSIVGEKLDAVDAKLKEAFPELPEELDLQTEIVKLIEGDSTLLADGLAEIEKQFGAVISDLDSDAGISAGINSLVGQAEAAVDGAIDSVLGAVLGDSETETPFAGLPSVDDILSGNFDPCTIPPTTASGKEKPTPPKKPEKIPEEPVEKKKQVKKEVSEEEYKNAVAARARKVFVKAVINTEKEMKSQPLIGPKSAKAFARTDMIYYIAQHVSVVYSDYYPYFALATGKKKEWYDKAKEYKNGIVLPFVGQSWAKARELYADVSLDGETWEKAIDIYHELEVKPLMEKNSE